MTYLLLARFCLAALYLTLNYLGNRVLSESTKPVLNALRLFGAICDGILVAWMLVFYISSWLLSASRHPFFSVSGYGYVLIYTVLMPSIMWYERGKLKKLFLNAMLVMVLLLIFICYKPHLPEGFVNLMPVLLSFNTLCLMSWLLFNCVFDFNMVHVCLSKFAQRLSPLDGLFGKPDDQTMLNHVVGLNFTLLNITYVYITGSANIVIVMLLTLSCLFYALLGLRHIDAYDKLIMPYGFMIHLLIIRLKHIKVLIMQFKTNALPKASAWAWITVLTFGLGSLSPCYAADLGEHKSLPPMDASLTGAATESEQPEVSSPVAEGSRAPRLVELLRKSSGNLEELVRRSGELEPVVQQASSSAEKAAQQASASAQEFVDHNAAKFGENMRKAPADMATKVLHGAAPFLVESPLLLIIV